MHIWALFKQHALGSSLIWAKSRGSFPMEASRPPGLPGQVLLGQRSGLTLSALPCLPLPLPCLFLSLSAMLMILFVPGATPKKHKIITQALVIIKPAIKTKQKILKHCF